MIKSDCVDHNKLWEILKEMGIPEHLTCILRNLNEGQEATFRTGHGTTDWFQTEKEVRQGCILSSCLTSMQITSCKMPGWMNHKLESRLTREGVGGGFRIGDTCIPMAYSCQCMAKTTTIL